MVSFLLDCAGEMVGTVHLSPPLPEVPTGDLTPRRSSAGGGPAAAGGSAAAAGAVGDSASGRVSASVSRPSGAGDLEPPRPTASGVAPVPRSPQVTPLRPGGGDARGGDSVALSPPAAVRLPLSGDLESPLAGTSLPLTAPDSGESGRGEFAVSDRDSVRPPGGRRGRRVGPLPEEGGAGGGAGRSGVLQGGSVVGGEGGGGSAGTGSGAIPRSTHAPPCATRTGPRGSGIVRNPPSCRDIREYF